MSEPATRHEPLPSELRLPTLSEAVRLRCPICWQAPMFAHPLKMHPTCPSCGHRYDRGNGYFLGAMMFSYTIVVVVLALLVTVMRLGGASWTACLVAGAVTVPLVGPLFAFPVSRFWWVFMERRSLRDGESADAALRAELAARKARQQARDGVAS